MNECNANEMSFMHIIPLSIHSTAPGLACHSVNDTIATHISTSSFRTLSFLQQKLIAESPSVASFPRLQQKLEHGIETESDSTGDV